MKTTVSLPLIPLALLDVAPWNARKAFDEGALAELTLSIRQAGVQVPLLIRPVGVPNGAKLAEQHYEIVAGHRRAEAARRAGLSEVPCIAREVTDTRARELALVDNLQREGLAPLDEAAGLRELMCAPGMTVEMVAGRVGKAPSYVGKRLKLLDAAEPVREALAADAISVAHALELARLPEVEQLRFLDRMQCGWRMPAEDDEGDDDWNDSGTCKYCGCEEDAACQLPDGPCHWTDADETVCSNPACVAQAAIGTGTVWKPATWGLAELRRRIGSDTLRVLRDAPFPLDADLLGTPCTGCPKRSSNAVLLFDDCATDTCTDRTCFNAKVTAWIEGALKAAQQEKRTLVRLADGYTEDKSAVRGWDVTVLDDAPCKLAEDAIWITGSKKGRFVKICRSGECAAHGTGRGRAQSVREQTKGKDAEAAKAERKKMLAKIEAAKKYRNALVGALAKVPVLAAVHELTVEVCVELCDGADPAQAPKLAAAIGWDADIFGYGKKAALRKKLAAYQSHDVLRFAVLAAHCGELYVSEYNADRAPEDLERIAKMLCIDLKAVKGSLEPESEKAAPQKPAQKAKPVAAKPKAAPRKIAKPVAKKKGGAR